MNNSPQAKIKVTEILIGTGHFFLLTLRFLRYFGGESLVEPVCELAMARSPDVAHLQLCPGQGWVWALAKEDSHALCEFNVSADLSFCEHSCVQKVPHHGPCGRSRYWSLPPHNCFPFPQRWGLREGRSQPHFFFPMAPCVPHTNPRQSNHLFVSDLNDVTLRVHL